MRMKSRRVMPSQVSLPAKPGITSMVRGPRKSEGGRVWREHLGRCLSEVKNSAEGGLVQQVSGGRERTQASVRRKRRKQDTSGRTATRHGPRTHAHEAKVPGFPRPADAWPFARHKAAP